MSDQTKEGNHEGTSNRGRVEQEFHSLPLEDKFAILFKMEVAAISEALSLAVNDPMKVLDKVGTKLNDLGERIEAEFRRATASTGKTGDGEAASSPAGAKKGGKKPASAPNTGAEHV
jgi:hypothetical protein